MLTENGSAFFCIDTSVTSGSFFSICLFKRNYVNMVKSFCWIWEVPSGEKGPHQRLGYRTRGSGSNETSDADVRRPHDSVLKMGFSTNSSGSAGTTTRTYTVSQFTNCRKTDDGHIKKCNNFADSLDDRKSCLNMFLLTLFNLKVFTVGFFSVNRATIMLSTHPEAFGCVGDESAVKEKKD